jgi:hypothetical protein
MTRDEGTDELLIVGREWQRRLFHQPCVVAALPVWEHRPNTQHAFPAVRPRPPHPLTAASAQQGRCQLLAGPTTFILRLVSSCQNVEAAQHRREPLDALPRPVM